MSSLNLQLTFGKCQSLLNTRGYRFTQVNQSTERYAVFRAYQAAEREPRAVGMPMHLANKGVGLVVVPGDAVKAFLFLYDAKADYYKKLPRPASECIEVPLSGGHVKWANALQKALNYLDAVEFQSGLQPFDPKDVPEVVYKETKPSEVRRFF